MLSSHCKASYHRSCWPGIHSLHHVLMLSDLYHQHEEGHGQGPALSGAAQAPPDIVPHRCCVPDPTWRAVAYCDQGA